MKRARLLTVAAGFAAAAVLPMTALANGSDTLTYSVSPTTHGAFSVVDSVLTTNPPAGDHLNDSTTTLPVDEKICHYTDSTCSPANNTQVGSASVKAQFICGFTSTNTYTIVWDNPPDTGYTPPSGETVVAETTANTTIFPTKSYITVDSGNVYRIHTPAYPDLVCHGTSAQITTKLNQDSHGATLKIHTNPSTVGTFTVTQVDDYVGSTNQTNNASAPYSTT
jgi:hypothetical protein